MPYASVLLPEHYSSHCHHCYEQLLAPIPCLKCTQPRYCSDLVSMHFWRHSGHRYRYNRPIIYVRFYIKICTILVSSRIMGNISSIWMYMFRPTSFSRNCSSLSTNSYRNRSGKIDILQIDNLKIKKPPKRLVVLATSLT